jgi:hypothetical protein
MVRKNAKIIICLVLTVIFVTVAFSVGSIYTSSKYLVFMAGCRSATLPNTGYEEVELSYPMQKMFQNYFGLKYDFTHQYIPVETSLEKYYETFNNGGFYYLITEDDQPLLCGFYK